MSYPERNQPNKHGRKRGSDYNQQVPSDWQIWRIAWARVQFLHMCENPLLEQKVDGQDGPERQTHTKQDLIETGSTIEKLRIACNCNENETEAQRDNFERDFVVAASLTADRKGHPHGDQGRCGDIRRARGRCVRMIADVDRDLLRYPEWSRLVEYELKKTDLKDRCHEN